MLSIRLGLIGLGAWARAAYLPVLQELTGVSVGAVAARSDTTRQFAREQFGEGVTAYATFDELLNDDRIEAVMVALPNELHAQGVEAAVRSGKHVFFEPPIGHTAEEVARILHVMSGSGAVVQCDLEVRYLPVMGFVRELLAGGAIGSPLMGRVRLWADWGYGGGNWTQSPEDEGFFPWLGCWYLDLLDCVFGQSPVRVSVTGGHAMNGRLMDHGLATLAYPNGGVGEVEFNLVAVGGLSVMVSVLGTRGELEAELTTGCCRRRAADGEWHEVTRDCSRPMHGFVGMRESITDFFACIREGRESEAGVEVCRRVHTGMLACARSEALGQSVSV